MVGLLGGTRAATKVLRRPGKASFTSAVISRLIAYQP